MRSAMLFLTASLFGFLLSGCAPMREGIPLGDIYTIFPSKYDGALSDVEYYIYPDGYFEHSSGMIGRICRNLEALTELCPVAGIEYGRDIPAYTREWFDDRAVIVLAFFAGMTHAPEGWEGTPADAADDWDDLDTTERWKRLMEADNRNSVIPIVDVNYISAVEQTLIVDLINYNKNARLDEHGRFVVLDVLRPYGIVIEVEAKHIEGAEMVRVYRPYETHEDLEKE